jgi:hypothetical protein
VVEADEYAGNFDAYRPSVIVLLNAEWDHPDVFANADAVYDAFANWIRAAGTATLVANVADDGVRHVLERLPRPGQVRRRLGRSIRGCRPATRPTPRPASRALGVPEEIEATGRSLGSDVG